MRVVLSRSAANYLRKEVLYLKGRNPHAAAAFSQRMRDALGRLQAFPELGAEAAGLPIPGARTMVMGDYLLDYTHDGNIMIIVSIRHGRMRPPGEYPTSDDETEFEV